MPRQVRLDALGPYINVITRGLDERRIAGGGANREICALHGRREVNRSKKMRLTSTMDQVILTIHPSAACSVIHLRMET